MQGTWAGNMITQAVADTLNLKFYIGESDENFMEITSVEPANARANWRLEYIGHKGQRHSVLTCPVISGRSLNGVSNSTNDFNEFENNSNTEYIINTQKIHVDNAHYELISYPYCYNTNGIELIVMRFLNLPRITLVVLCCSLIVPQEHLCRKLLELLNSNLRTLVLVCLWVTSKEYLFKINLQGIIINKKVSSATTNSKTCIDLIFTNLPETQISFLIIETHFSDHWGVCALTNCFWMYM